MALMVLFASAMWSCHNKNAKQENEDASMPQILKERECDTIVWSDDGIFCCYGLSPTNKIEIPQMIIQYTANGEAHWVESLGIAEDCHLCLMPEAIYHVNDNSSTIYLVYGYGGYTGNGASRCLKAYRLDDNGLQPAFVFDGYEQEGSICLEAPFAEEDSESEVLYYNSEDSTIYLKENLGFLKYKWNGEKFVPENSSLEDLPI